MNKGIFISYRRSDSQGMAGRIYDRLLQSYSKSRIFFDVDDIPAGEDFLHVINSAIDKCDIMLVIIGDQWLNKPRLQTGSDDYVVLEIKLALEKGIKLIPVLVNNAQLPAPNELPAEIKDITRKNAVQLRHARFEKDMEGLLLELKKENKVTVRKTAQTGIAPVLITIMVIAVIVIAGAYFIGNKATSRKERMDKVNRICNSHRYFAVPDLETFEGFLYDSIPVRRKAFDQGIVKKTHYSKREEYAKFMQLVNPGVVERYKKLTAADKEQFLEIKNFYASRSNITSGDWEVVMNKKPPPLRRRTKDGPLESVTWEQMQEFVDELNNYTGNRFRLLSKKEEEYMSSLGIKTEPAHYIQEYSGSDLSFFDMGFRICADRIKISDGPVMEPQRVFSYPTL